ncbi:hypothetical protein EYF80_041203 [Liparis tanakae]|uniref:Uncharacterized protein n=1 Tax=Liparis tanakae TaxID=230148 RepID=A0A4Z2G711_9TELE|nr:hypothetical protein EYF80_041203 [Liparis tanakae]
MEHTAQRQPISSLPDALMPVHLSFSSHLSTCTSSSRQIIIGSSSGSEEEKPKPIVEYNFSIAADQSERLTR